MRTSLLQRGLSFVVVGITAFTALFVVEARTTSPVRADAFTFTSVVSSMDNSCAVTTSHRAFCWGDNYQGRLGVGSLVRKFPTPTEVVLPDHELVAQVSVSSDSGCAVSTIGHAFCWGSHGLGNGRITTSTSPVPISAPAGVTFTQVTAGPYISCAITTATSGNLWCWGDAMYLGINATPYDALLTPVQPLFSTNISITQAASEGGTMCALDSTGSVWCWGENNMGQVGANLTDWPNRIVYTPTQVALPAGVTAASLNASMQHACVITTTHKAYCWGHNTSYGALGNNSGDDAFSPVKMLIPNDADVLTLSSGMYHTCVLLTSYDPWCVGDNASAHATGVHLSGRAFHHSEFPTGVSLRSVGAGIAVTYWVDNQGRLWGSGVSDWHGLNDTIASGTAETWDPVAFNQFGTPTLANPSITNVDAEAATVSDDIVTNRADTSVHAQLADTSSFSTILSDMSLPTIATSGTSVATFTGLAPRTTFWVRFVGTNIYGSTTSSVASFTTLGDAPVIVGGISASRINGQSALLTSLVNPGRLTTTVTAAVATNSNMSTIVGTINMSVVTGSTPVAVQGVAQGLLPRRTYWVQVTATNRLGTSTDTPTSFATVGDMPSATLSFTSSSLYDAALMVRPHSGGLDTVTTVVVSTTADFRDTVSQSSVSTTADSDMDTSVTIPNLRPHVTYWARAVATNALGSTTSAPVRFSTAGQEPILSVSLNSNVNSDSVMISSTVNVSGMDSFVMAQVSDVADFSNDITEYYVYTGAAASTQRLTTELKGLDPHTTLYVRLKGTNEVGVGYSNIISFTTPWPTGVVINNGDDTTTNPHVMLTITAPTDAVAVRVSNTNDMRNSSLYPINGATSIPWTMVDSGDPEAARDVYVMFVYRNGKSSPAYWASITLVSETDIIGVTSQGLKATASGVHANAVTLRVNGAKVNQKAFVQVRSAKGTVSRSVMASKTGNYSVTLPTRQKVAYLRFVDAAGHATAWIKIKIG